MLFIHTDVAHALGTPSTTTLHASATEASWRTSCKANKTMPQGIQSNLEGNNVNALQVPEQIYAACKAN